MRSVSVRLADLQRVTIPIGYVGENLYTKVIVDCKKEFDDHPTAVVGMTVEPPEGDPYPAVVTRDGDFVVWEVSASDLVYKGAGNIQISFTVDGTIVGKSPVGRIMVNKSIVPSGEVPEPLDDFLTRASTALNEIPDDIAAALAEAKASGEFDGADGYSPTVTVTEISGGHQITITDAEGDHIFTVMDGVDGQRGQDGNDGVSPTVSVSDITGGHRVTIVDAEGTHTFDVMDGQSVDPTSIIDDTSEAENKVWSAKESASLKSAINVLEPSASASDVGKMLKVKTVADGKVTAYEFGEGGGGVDPQDIAQAVDDWCDANITNPDSPPLDRSLTSSSAAAPADMLGEVRSAVLGNSETPTVSTVSGINIVENGSAYQSQYGRNTKYIPVTSGTVYSLTVTASANDKSSRLAFSANVPADSVAAQYITAKNGSYTYQYTASANGYFSISYYGSDITSVSATAQGNSGLIDQVEDLKDELADAVKKIDGDSLVLADFSAAYIDSTGNAHSGGEYSNICTTEIIDKERFRTITISCDDGYQFNYATFNGTTFVEKTDWFVPSDGLIKIPNTYSLRIGVATQQSGTSESIETVFSHVHIALNNNDLPSLYRSIDDIGLYGQPFVNRILSSDTGGKIIHYSIDDVFSCLKDITDNQYASIFENTFFSNLKTAHDNYGCCFTLNCFNTESNTPSYSISNLPNRYQAEIQGCKGWLRFSFHAEDDETNYNTDGGILASYNTFVSAIYTLAGDYDCIDRITRLGFFGGNLTNILAIKNASHGIIGLLCADNITRESYYLDPEQNEIVQSKGKYIDPINELIFCRSTTRMLGNAIAELEGNLCYQKYVEIFWHEQDGFPTINLTDIATWATQNGYVNAFPCDIFK